MPLFRVTVKRMKNTNGVRLEPGMHVEIPSNSFSNPVTTNGGQVVADAFYLQHLLIRLCLFEALARIHGKNNVSTGINYKKGWEAMNKKEDEDITTTSK